MNPYFDFASVGIISWILLALAAVCAVWALCFGWRAALRTVAYYRSRKTPETGSDTAIPSASVIVLSDDDENRLDRFLSQLQTQNHPDFEVIAVCESTADRSAALSEYFSTRYPNVRITFVPPESKNLSRRKLALTLGQKAAKKEVAILTMCNSTIASPSWLREMCLPFADKNIEMVLGYAPADAAELRKATRLYRSFDSTLDAARWLGNAIAGKAYRGDGHNMALRIDTFFRHKGYGKSMYLESGDDDLFVSEVATDGNTAVCLTETSRITMNYGSVADTIWKNRKDQYNFTSRYLRKGPFMTASMLSWCQWLVPLLIAAAIIISIPSLIPVIAGAMVALTFWSVQASLYSRVANALGTASRWWLTDIFMLWHPIGNALFRLARRNNKSRHYTWKRN